jgi:hypothetical protein
MDFNINLAYITIALVSSVSVKVMKNNKKSREIK